MNKHYDPAGFDEGAVQELCRGSWSPHHRTVDFWEAIRRLNTRERLTDGQIAYRIGKPRRTVLRVRTKLGVPAVVGTGCRSLVSAPAREKRLG